MLPLTEIAMRSRANAENENEWFGDAVTIGKY